MDTEFKLYWAYALKQNYDFHRPFVSLLNCDARLLVFLRIKLQLWRTAKAAQRQRRDDDDDDDDFDDDDDDDDDDKTNYNLLFF
jgi:hypothetical protein